MLKWLLRGAAALLLLILLLFFFRFQLDDGKMIVEPRPEAERRTIQDKVREAVPGAEPPTEQRPSQLAADPPQDRVSDADRQALESLLEEE